MSIPVRTVLFAAVIAAALTVAPTAFGEEPGLYDKPHEIFEPAALTALENQLQAGQPLEALAAEVERQISRYTSQFSAEKRIAVERQQVPEGKNHWDVNLVRLIDLARNREPGSRYFIGDSPYMYRLHVLLGRCYEQQGDIKRALSQYNQAFRYNPIEIPFSRLPATPVAAADTDPVRDSSEMEKVYLSMLDGFANPDRIQQETNATWVNRANRFRELMELYTQLRKDLEQQRKQPAVARAVLLRGGQADPAAEEARLARMEERMTATINEMEAIRTGAFQDYKRQKEKQTGDLVFRMAQLTREVEKENKQFERLTRRSAFYGDSPTALERTELSDFVGYGILLELAHRIDPRRLDFLEALAEEYTKSRKTSYAIEFEKRFLELAAQENQRNPGSVDAEKINTRMNNLAGLYTDEQRYLKAIQIYEDLLNRPRAITDGQGLLSNVQQSRYHLAELYFKHTGEYRRSRQLYTQVVTELPPDPLDDFSQEMERQRIRFRVNAHLGAIHRRIRRTELEKENLDEARQVYLQVEQIRDAILQEQNNLKEQILALKQQLRTNDDAEIRRQYYRLLYIEQPDIDERLSQVRTRLRSMDVGSILERRAFLYLKDRELDLAIQLYNEMLGRANSSAASRARKNILLVNRTLEDGILRTPELPAQW